MIEDDLDDNYLDSIVRDGYGRSEERELENPQEIVGDETLKQYLEESEKKQRNEPSEKEIKEALQYLKLRFPNSHYKTILTELNRSVQAKDGSIDECINAYNEEIINRQLL